MDPSPDEPQIIVVGPDGASESADPLAGLDQAEAADEGELARLVEQPAKVMRIGSMIKQLLEEVRGADLDEASRRRLSEIYSRSIVELEQGLAPS